jgi:filamentous hemagglutinin family protein
MKKIIASCLICAFLVNQSLLSVLAADIIVGGPLPTDTNIQTNGNITDIFTNTTVNNGQIGINSFDRFNVNQGDIVNLQLINNQNKLVNLIFDSSASQINGVVNSYLNGQIGGNVLFANPNGFVIGESGIFNVGSLTMMTPTMDEMNKLFKSGIISANSWDEAKINSLISFTFDDNDYFIAGTKDNTYILQPSKIVVNGKINSGAGIDLLSGLGVDINPGAELNANMDFKINEGKIVASKKELVSSNTKNDSVYKTAMHSGNGIVIIAQNKGTEHKDYLSSIVILMVKLMPMVVM